jgi:hypothetical protein
LKSYKRTTNVPIAFAQLGFELRAKLFDHRRLLRVALCVVVVCLLEQCELVALVVDHALQFAGLAREFVDARRERFLRYQPVNS